jgi:Nif-specific regulatory protein
MEVSYQLTARTGPLKGTSWLVSEQPLVIGRDVGCSITINDPLVSRRHCEIVLQHGMVLVRDLGSSNATFVNAAPIKEAELKLGDEVAIGSAIFFLTTLRQGNGAILPAGKAPAATHALRIGEPTYLDEDTESLFSQGKPRTAEDLATLFNIGRGLSQEENRSGLIASLLERVSERFQPLTAWVALFQGEESPLAIYPVENAAAISGNPALLNIVWRAIREPRGILLPERWPHEDQAGIRTTMVAPIALGKETVGAIVARVETPQRIYDESDLEFLLAIAHTAAPYLRATERLEQLERENQRLVAGTPNAGPIVGTGRAIGRVRALARDCARSDLNVMILGETGTGKEMVARLIHDLSERADRPLVIVNCAAIPDELFESELFGHERGAFTGAHAAKAGLLEESDGGTIFLDEVGDLSPHNQARLLRAIETGTFRRVGGTANVHVQVRVISATNKDLAAEVGAGRFRRDLYHRLNSFIIPMPPLRERRTDIPILAEHFLHLARQRFHATADGFAPETLKALQDRPWLGNVRELRNVIERAVVVAKHNLIRPEDLAGGTDAAQEEPGFLTLDELERRHIVQAIERCGGNITAAADLLKIGRSTLYRKASEYGIT